MKVGIIGSGNMAVSLIKGFRTEKKNKIICSDIEIKNLFFFHATGFNAETYTPFFSKLNEFLDNEYSIFALALSNSILCF